MGTGNASKGGERRQDSAGGSPPSPRLTLSGPGPTLPCNIGAPLAY